MARIRTIKPEFWESPDTAKASPLARLLYIAMWNWADDYGVGKWTERELLAFAFPNDHDVTTADFPSLVKEVADAFGTQFYTSRGRRYYRIPAWDEHQRTERRAKCKHPLPDDPDSAPDQAICSAAESVGSSAAIVGSSVAGKGTGEQGKGNRGTGEQAERARLRALAESAYEAWPRKEKREPSIEKFLQSAKRIDPDLLHAHVLRFAEAYRTHKTRQFTPALVAWLNQGRWTDDLPTAEEDRRPMSNTDRNLSYVQQLAAQEAQGHMFEIEGVA